MPEDDPRPSEPFGRSVGFSAYSDDTPRPAGVAAEPQSWAPSGALRQAILDPPDEPVARMRVWPAFAVAAFVFVSVLAGVALLRMGHARVTRSIDEEASVTPKVQVVTNPATPMPVAPLPATTTPANSLPAATVTAAAPPPATSPTPFLTAAVPPRATPLLSVPAAAAVPPGAPAPLQAPHLAVAAPPPQALAPPPPRELALREPAPARTEPGPCEGLRSYAQQVVCGDPQLAAADRRLARAYAAAVRSGAPEEDLRADQEDWLRIREDAARYSRRAVADVYRQRIGELEAIARDAPD